MWLRLVNDAFGVGGIVTSGQGDVFRVGGAVTPGRVLVRVGNRVFGAGGSDSGCNDGSEVGEGVRGGRARGFGPTEVSEIVGSDDGGVPYEPGSRNPSSDDPGSRESPKKMR